MAKLEAEEREETRQIESEKKRNLEQKRKEELAREREERIQARQEEKMAREQSRQGSPRLLRIAVLYHKISLAFSILDSMVCKLNSILDICLQVWLPSIIV